MARPINLSDKWFACRQLLWSFIIDKHILKTGKVFYDNKTGKNQDKILLEDYGKLLNTKEWDKVTIKMSWAAWQMIANELEIDYPKIDFAKWEDITYFFKDSVLAKWAVKNKLIDDETLQMLRAILLPFYVVRDEVNKRIWLYPKETSRALADEYNPIQVLKKEIELWYVNKQIWDKQHKWWYTHILRHQLKLELQSWQRRMLYNWKQFNFIAWSRRIGKTFTSAYIAKRELYMKGWGYGARERQIIFVSVSEEKMWQPLQYMLMMCKEDMDAGYIKYTQRDKQFENTITWAKLIFRSAWSRTWAASYWADLVILDEAAMISDQFREDLLPIVIQEGATVFAISTINEDVKDNWYYRELVRWELWLDDDYNCIRVSIDDNELIDDERKEKMKEALKNNPMKYWTQLYSIFPAGNTVFSLTWVIQPPNDIVPQSVIIWYDPGKVSDNAAVVIIDPNELRVIEEIHWHHMDYKTQYSAMQEIKKKYPASTIIMDRTGVWEAVVEIFGQLIDVWVKYKGMWDTNFNATFWYYQSTKMSLVESVQVYFDTYWLKVNSDLTNLISELKWFQKISQGRRTIQYAGVWVKDDSVNALMVACFQMRHVLGITKKDQVTHDKSVGIDKVNDVFINWLFEYDEYNDSVLRKFTY